VLYGALVGGPSAPDDAYTDNRGDYVMNEVATDYNAGFTSALARIYGEYGGAPLANFPQPEQPDIAELSVETTVMQNETRSTGVKVMVYNKSAFPARALTAAKFRYYFTRDGDAALTVSTPYTQGCPGPTAARQYSGDIWYVEVDCSGYTIAPAGQSAHRMEVQLKIGVVEGGTWDPADDPSYRAAAGPNPGVPLYEGTTRVWGNEPGSSPSPSPSASASASPSPSPSPSVPPSPSPSPSVPPSSGPAAACRVAYTTNDWSTGFTANVTVTNTGTAAVNGWSLVFAYTAGQRVTQAWSATATQTGTQVTVTNAAWNGALAPGASVSFGMNGTHSGSNPRPTAFVLNGSTCAIA
jgi:endoglucanase